MYLSSFGAGKSCVSLVFLHTSLRDPLLSSSLHNSRDILSKSFIPMPISCGVLDPNFVSFHCEVSVNENTPTSESSSG